MTGVFRAQLWFLKRKPCGVGRSRCTTQAAVAGSIVLAEGRSKRVPPKAQEGVCVGGGYVLIGTPCSPLRHLGIMHSTTTTALQVPASMQRAASPCPETSLLA